MGIYFLRHGESKSNEQNRFAGRFDSPLTDLGRRQAERAGRSLSLAGVTIDEIHVSTLMRARETAEIILAQKTNAHPISVHVSESLIERDFGTLSEQNKSLIKKAFGHSTYENMFHRAAGAPPAGESFQAMYDRTRDYYEKVLLPASLEGKTILVVAHKYIVEMFALIAAQLPTENYFDFKIPNSKPSRFEELGDFAKKASRTTQAAAEIIEIHLSKFLLAATFLGFFAKQLVPETFRFGSEFLIGTGIFLAINSFMSVLRLNPDVIKSSFGAIKDSRVGVLMRATAGLAILKFAHHPIGVVAGVFFLLPPAMTAPTLSLMWGGDYFFSAKLTGALSIVSMVTLYLISKFGDQFGFNFQLSFFSFFALFLVAVLTPGVAAQWIRKKDPIQAGAIATNHNWIGGASLIPLSFLSMVQVAPQITRAFIEVERARILTDILTVIAVYAVSRILATVAAHQSKIDLHSKFDVFICQMFPNIFLMSALLRFTPQTGIILPLLSFTFFFSLCFEEWCAVKRFANLNIPKAKAKRVLLRTRNAHEFAQ